MATPEDYKKCLKTAAFGSMAIGMSLGALAGSPGGIPGMIIGTIIGGIAGFVAGAITGSRLCPQPEGWGGGGGSTKVGFDEPRFSKLELKADPNPVEKNKDCRIELRWNVVNNNDRARCEITYTITAYGATPQEAPKRPPIADNQPAFQRVVTFTTKWPEEHDGRPVNAHVYLVAKKGGETYRLNKSPSGILVEVTS